MDAFKTPIKKKKTTDGEHMITIPPSPFLNRLGYGTGVSVMQLVRSPQAGQIRSPWALKMINKKVRQEKVFTDRLKTEAKLLQRMSHPNIVGFRAFSQEKRLFLGMEACDLSLGDMIEKRVDDEGDIFTPHQLLKVALDVGNGLDYLHTTMKLLHADMKSYNILVNGDFVVCKICDFGVALPLDENGKLDTTNKKEALYYGTEAWSAPEVINGEEISDKTDVWSLGLTLWEMLALAPPHSQGGEGEGEGDSWREEGESGEEASFGEDNMFENYGTRPALPAAVSPQQYAEPLALFYCCTEASPGARPAARRLARAAGLMISSGKEE